MITSMERLEIVCLRSVFTEVTEYLQSWGNLHMEDVSLAAEGAPGYLHKLHFTDSENAELDLLERTGRMLTEVAPLLPATPRRHDVAAAVKSLGERRPQEWARMARRLGRDLRSLTRRKANVRDNLEVVQNSCRFFSALVSVSGDRPIMLGETGRAIVLNEMRSGEMARLKKRFEDTLGADSEFYFHKFSSDKGVALVTYPAEKNAAAGRIIADEGIAPVEMFLDGGEDISLQEWLEKLERASNDYQKNADDIHAELDTFANEKAAELKAMQMLLADRLAGIEVRRDFAASDMVVFMHGWAPSTEVAMLSEGMEERFGGDALQDKERLLLEMGKLIREVFLQQNAFSEADACSSPEKTGGLLEVLLLFRERSADVLEGGVGLNRVLELSVREELAQLREVGNDEFEDEKERVISLLQKEFDGVAIG